MAGASCELKVFKKWFKLSLERRFFEISIYLSIRQPPNRLSKNLLISGGLASPRHSLIFNSSRPWIWPIAYIAPFCIAFESIGIPEMSIDRNYDPFIWNNWIKGSKLVN
jgi:hypothetical protein